MEQLIDYITHSWIGQCANSKLVTDTGCHVTLRIHLIHSMPTFDTLSIIYSWYYLLYSIIKLVISLVQTHVRMNDPFKYFVFCTAQHSDVEPIVQGNVRSYNFRSYNFV